MKNNDLSFKKLEAIDDLLVLKESLKVLILQAVRTHGLDAKGASRAAYELAGLLALDLVRQMDHDDPYLRLLEMAGQLEMPKRHQEAGASWRRFEELVKEL